MTEDELALLVATVLQSAKYRHVTPDLVRTIGAQELSKRRNLKAAVKATKNKLHQTVGAYWQGEQDYTAWLSALANAASDPRLLRTVAQTIMAHHASTQERLPILDEFYPTILGGLPPIHSILDLACGLNPLTIPWMPLTGQVHYQACDIAGDQVDFLRQALPLLGVTGDAALCNLLQEIPAYQADVVLLLKTLPCLEQVDPAIGVHLLEKIDAPVVIVSFPAHSLGGRRKGMTTTYPAHLRALLQSSTWRIEEFTFATELVFRLTR
ncbi:MAG: hypothetical protein R3C14_07300 [Caldilineaceae bacterium]